MSLNEAEKNELHFAIENTIKYVTEMRFLFKQEKVKSDIGFEHEADFLLGYFWGMVHSTFRANFKSVFKKSPTPQQQSDIIPIIVGRMNEVRDMIFRKGD
jgi:hypothetical protein